MKILLTCFLGNIIKIIEIVDNDPLSILKQKLDIKDNYIKFIFKGMSYSISSNSKFKDIGITENTILIFICSVIAG
jgi:hypothetical protein